MNTERRTNRTFVIGSIHPRVGSPLLGYTFFPIYVAAMVWGGIYLREARLRELLPLRHPR